MEITMRRYMPDEVGLHIDHIIPVSKGGKTVASNLQVLCSKCNGSKSNKLRKDSTDKPTKIITQKIVKGTPYVDLLTTSPNINPNATTKKANNFKKILIHIFSLAGNLLFYIILYIFQKHYTPP